MEPKQEQKEVQKKEPKLDDLGTRYEHLQDYRDSLETCIEILKDRPFNRDNQERMIKFLCALEVITVTLDSYSGYKDTMTEYKLYQLLNSVPVTKEGIKALGGTPLE